MFCINDGSDLCQIKIRDLPDEYLQWLILKEYKTSQKDKYNHTIFHRLYNKPRIDEKKMIRQAWKKAIGIDIWYPYYKYKKAEDWIKKKCSVRINGLKGKPEFNKDQILYVFKSKF